MTINDIIIEIVKKSKKELTAREIAEKIYADHPEHNQRKQKNNAKLKETNNLINQYVAEISARYNGNSLKNISRTTDRPQKYYYDEGENNKNTISNKINSSDNDEKSLYPKFVEFCKSINIQALRIDEKRSIKGQKNENKWLHPDIVGLQDTTNSFSNIIKKCINNFKSQTFSLYSFEIKTEINSSNLREFFFQTVSNSSWANYSYFVSEKIKDDKVYKELELLCESFKIGYIEINRDEPLESEIKIPAIKTDLDWSIMNRIAEANSDFKQFITNINGEYERKNTEQPKWD